jgi:PKHD-type hydroxylase
VLPENPEAWPYPCDHETAEAIFTPAECNEITRIGKEASLSPAVVIKNNGVNKRQPLIRHAKIARIIRDERTEWMFETICAAIVRANTARWHYELTSIDRIDFAEYSIGGHYLWHTDVGPGRNITRKLSFSVQLSAPNTYLGGKLQFLRGYLRPTASRGHGSITIFPSFMVHRVNPVLFGKRYALVGWIKGDNPLR